MCCDGWYGNTPVGECPDCGEEIDVYGDAVTGCFHSPIICETCGSAPCEEYC